MIQADALAGQAITDSTTEILELAGSRDPILTAKVLSGLGDYTEDEQEQIDRGIAAYIDKYDLSQKQESWILFREQPDSIEGLEWLPETSLTQAEWDQAKSIAAFLVDD